MGNWGRGREGWLLEERLRNGEYHPILEVSWVKEVFLLGLYSQKKDK